MDVIAWAELEKHLHSVLDRLHVDLERLEGHELYRAQGMAEMCRDMLNLPATLDMLRPKGVE